MQRPCPPFYTGLLRAEQVVEPTRVLLEPHARRERIAHDAHRKPPLCWRSWLAAGVMLAVIGPNPHTRSARARRRLPRPAPTTR